MQGQHHLHIVYTCKKNTNCIYYLMTNNRVIKKVMVIYYFKGQDPLHSLKKHHFMVKVYKIYIEQHNTNKCGTVYFLNFWVIIED